MSQISELLRSSSASLPRHTIVFTHLSTQINQFIRQLSTVTNPSLTWKKKVETKLQRVETGRTQENRH